MPFQIGPLELVIILAIALIIIGPGRLPEVGAALGKSIREFRRAATDVQDAAKIDSGTKPPAVAPTSSAAAVATSTVVADQASTPPTASAPPVVEPAPMTVPTAAPELGAVPVAAEPSTEAVGAGASQPTDEAARPEQPADTTA